MARSTGRKQQRVWLADTSVRIYRQKNAVASVCLHNYIMVSTNCRFDLTEYMRKFSCTLFVDGVGRVSLDQIGIAVYGKYELNTMMHGLVASGTAPVSIRHASAA